MRFVLHFVLQQVNCYILLYVIDGKFLKGVAIKTKSIRFSEDDIKLIDRLADEMGVSHSELFRIALKNLQSNHVKEHKTNKPSVPQSDLMLEFLKEQIQVKDKQIEELTKSLSLSQESLMRSQILNAADKNEFLPAATKDDKRSLFNRLFHRH